MNKNRFLGVVGAVVLTVLLLPTLGCDNGSSDDSYTPGTGGGGGDVVVPDSWVPAGGIVDWKDFAAKTGSDFTIPVPNIEEIIGFSGNVSYTEVQDFLKSSVYDKTYNTNNLDISFAQGNEIIPSVLEQAFKKFSKVNIVPDVGVPVVMSSGETGYQIFDIDTFYNAIASGLLYISPGAIYINSTTNPAVLGITNSDSNEKDAQILIAITEFAMFKDMPLEDGIILSGNINGSDTFFSYKPDGTPIHTITIGENAYYDGAGGILPVSDLIEFIGNGFTKIKLKNTTITGDGTAQIVNIDNADMDRVNFYNIDMTNISCNSITATNGLTITDSTLPAMMKDLVVKGTLTLNGVSVSPIVMDPVTGTFISGGCNMARPDIDAFYIEGFIPGVDGIYITLGSKKGKIGEYRGYKGGYDILKEIADIKKATIESPIAFKDNPKLPMENAIARMNTRASFYEYVRSFKGNYRS